MKLLSALAASFVLLGCNKIQIRDIELKWDAGARGAYVTHLLSDSAREIPKAQWDEERIGHACISEEDVGWMIATVEKACSELKALCNQEKKAQIKAIAERVGRGRVLFKKRG